MPNFLSQCFVVEDEASPSHLKEAGGIQLHHPNEQNQLEGAAPMASTLTTRRVTQGDAEWRGLIGPKLDDTHGA